MDLEEAKENIGKEVIFKDSMFENCDFDFIDILKSASKIVISNVDKPDVIIKLFNKSNEMFVWCFVSPKHLKLKEQPMQNYKIQVTPETSEEVQRLFFELGYSWNTGNNIPKYKDYRYIYTLDEIIAVTSHEEIYNDLKATEITITQLRDLVVLKRNDVGDATHEDNCGMLWFIGCFHYLWDLESKKWIKTKPINLRFKEIKKLENISVEVVAVDVECQEEMTWQDALRAVADGKEVETNPHGNNWISIGDYYIADITRGGRSFRIKPQTIELNGEFTREELLEIVGEME